MKNNFENIPKQMKEEAYFCTHYKKTPTNNTKPNDKKTFYSYDEMMKIKKDYEGIGIGIFDSYCGIDIDHCIDDKGSLSEVAKDIIKTIKSYTEKSLSGTGIHIIFKCENQEQINSMKYYTKMNENQLQKNGFKETGGLEIYQGNFDNRYLTLTGNVINKELATIDFDTIKKVIEKYMKKPESNYQSNLQKTTTYQNNTSEDEKFLQIGLQKDDKLIELWNSTPSGSGGNESETDQALMNKIAFWTNKNETLMKLYFEQSPYFQRKDDYHQKKWNTREDYQQSTISKAIAITNETARSKNIDFVNNIKERELQNNLPEESKIDLDSLSTGKRIDRFFEKIEKQTFKSIPTGFKTFDEKTNGGFLNQSLITLGGGTSTGKTTLAINLALNFAKSRPVLYYSLEMGEEMIQAKIFSNISYTGGGMTIPSDNFLKCYDKNIMTEYQQSKVREELEKHEELNQLFIRYPQECNIDYILKEVKLFNDELEKQGKEKAILFVDYLQYLQGNPREDSQTLIKRIQRELKKYTIENDSLVILLIANSREADTEGKKSSISGGRDSSDIEYSSEYNLQLNFTEWERGEKTHFTSRTELKRQNPRRMTITIHKNRMGITGEMIDFTFNPVSNTFKEVNQEEKATRTQITKRI